MSLSVDSLKTVAQTALSEKNNTRRNFIQSVQILIKLREVDISKPENRFSLLVELPNVNEKMRKSVCVLTEGSLLTQARSLGVDVLSRADLEPLAGNKKMARRLARKYDFFISEAPLMPLVGRIMGQFLAPRDKMPTPVPPNSDISSNVLRLTRSVQVRLKVQKAISVVIGKEDMPVEQLAENASRVISAVEEKLTGGKRNIDYVALKTAIGRKVKLEEGKHG